MKMHFLRPIVILFLSVFSCSLALQARITDKALTVLLEEHGIPGLSIAVVKKSKTKTYQVGYADVEKAIPLAEKHRMLLGSIGKSFFAAQVLLLQEEGKIDIQEKANHYLKQEWFNSLPNAADITIESLLNHTSGIPEYVYAPELWQGIKDEPEKQWTAADRMAFIQDREAHFPVGQGWSYADANYIILGTIIEAITGEKVYDLVQRNFLNPQKLLQTAPSTQAKLDNIAAAYTGNLFGNVFGEKISNIGEYGMNPQFEWTGGGFISHPKDLANWIYRLYRGEVLSPSSTDLMFQAMNRQTGKADIVGYGFGAEIYATRYGKAYGHTGFMPGFNSAMFYYSEQDLAIALQMNADPYHKTVEQGTSVHILLDKIMAMLVKKPKTFQKSTSLYLVRHAEKAKDGTNDPDLLEEGKLRAESLVNIFADKPIAAVYSTPYKRTIQTAEPLAKAIGKEVQIYSPRNMLALFEILSKHEGQSVLIVGHSNTVPDMINFLLQESKLEHISEKEYGRMHELIYSSKKQVFQQWKY